MIWAEDCGKIIMVTNPIEDKKVKCVPYWPETTSSLVYGDIAVTLLQTDVLADYTIRTLRLSKVASVIRRTLLKK
jgi:protein tyrosine phosphatase